MSRHKEKRAIQRQRLQQIVTKDGIDKGIVLQVYG